MTLDLIQYPDPNIGPSSYSHLAPDQILVTSIFYTIQGEGPYAGTPAIFVRLAGCNRGRKEDMGCKFCDTDFRFANGKAMTFDQIYYEMIVQNRSPAWLGRSALIVITGGEPMMQDNLSEFLAFLIRKGYRRIQIESNGDRLASGFPLRPEIKLGVSPKIVKDKYRPSPPSEVLARVDFLKFVIDARPDNPYHDVPEYAKVIPGQVWVSPLTVYLRPVAPGGVASFWTEGLIDHNRTAANYKRAVELALKYGFHLTNQMHLLFGVA